MRLFNGILSVALISGLAGCTTPGQSNTSSEIFDPYEADNRRVHAFNKSVDTAVVRPVAVGYANNVAPEFQTVVSNFAGNLGTPSSVVNQILQGDLGGATRNTLRFAINTTLGIGGMADAAAEFGLTEDKSNFGETLYTWGVGEGAYVELPLLGPSTQRATVGKVVDFFTDPLDYVIPNPEKYYATGTKVVSGLGSRGKFADTIDSVLYDSADSYAQARILYLQNRRFELGDTRNDTFIDPNALDTEGF